MIVFGLTGGIASGKSFVAQLFKERGAEVFNADEHAHAVLEEREVRNQIVERWGSEIQEADGSLNRKRIAAKIFGFGAEAEAERRFLEGLIHPRVRLRLKADLEKAQTDQISVVILDVPLLLEAGWDKSCTAVIFVDTPENVRQQRAADRGWSSEELAQREAAQMPINDKKRLSDTIIPGTDRAAAEAAIKKVWQEWAEPNN